MFALCGQELWVSYNILMRAVLLSTVAVDAFYDRYVCSKVWLLRWSRFQKEGLPTSNFPSLASFVFLESHHFVGAAPHGGGQQIKDCAKLWKEACRAHLVNGHAAMQGFVGCPSFWCRPTRLAGLQLQSEDPILGLACHVLWLLDGFGPYFCYKLRYITFMYV